MDKHIDKSLGGLRYALATILGRNEQATKVIHYLNDKEHEIDGDFILTIGKSSVILTRNRKPVIVKRWTSLPLGSYVDDARKAAANITGLQVIKAYKDTDGWIWEWLASNKERYLIAMLNCKYIYAISF